MVSVKIDIKELTNYKKIIPKLSWQHYPNFSVQFFFSYFERLPYWVSQGVCFEKDEVPVDVDALNNDECLDIYGNIYKLGSELYSCCDCFRL